MGSQTCEDPNKTSPEVQARGDNESLEHRQGRSCAGYPRSTDRTEGQGARGHSRQEQTNY